MLQIKPRSEVDEVQIEIVETCLDSFLHVNHVTYLRLFEEARWEFLTRRGYGLMAVHGFRAGPVIIDVQAKFRKEVKNRERCKIQTSCYDYRRRLFKIDQVLINERGDHACTAVFTCGLFHLDERKLMEPTPAFLYAIGLSDERPMAHLR